jgi:Flp pilus assembly protein TadG
MRESNTKAGGRARAGRLLRDRSGAAAVEFALVFPLLLVMLLGIFEFGRVWNIHQVVTDAAREGARRAVVRDGLTGTAKQAAVAGAIQNRLASTGLVWNAVPLNDATVACPTSGTWNPPTPSTTAVSVSGCGWGGATATQARVVIRTPFPFQFLGPVMNLLASGGGVGPVLLRADVSMRNE